MNKFRSLPFIVFLLFCGNIILAQTDKDSTKTSIAKRAFEEGLNLITRTHSDTVKNEKNADRFKEYTGKIIRDIYVESAGFEVSIYGTEKKIVQKIGNIANKLHINTREKTIRQHLFVKPDQPVNPYRLGDNERYLRSQDFILESRIIVTPVDGTDSVDLTVVTRDVFSIGARAGGSFPSAPELQVYDANLDGRGQKLQADLLFDVDRTPKFGFGVLYSKSSLLGTLTDLEIAYSQLNSGIGFGDETEYSTYLKLERPLVSPYSRLAGGLELSHNWSKNVFNRPDSAFLDYRYNVFNIWTGYNLGANKAVQDRRREFIAARYFDGNFVDIPDQEDYIRQNRYSSQKGFLAEFTLYQKNYFKTRYVYGFGRTEDQPYGYSLAISSGYIRSAGANRPYSAIKLNYSNVKGKGGFYSANLNMGGYFNNKKPEDVVIQSDFRYFTPAYSLGRYKLRTGVHLAYSQVFYRRFGDWMEINSTYISGLRVDILDAKQRTSSEAEARLFTPWAIAGFRIAPFASIQTARLYCGSCERKNNRYYGLSAGLRTRNENLIFGTMELKFTYIPSDEFGFSKFVFRFRQNLRILDDREFVRAPSLIRYN